MENAVQILEKMESVLDMLISNAEKLKDLSLEDGFNEEAINPLQQRQEVHAVELNELEDKFNNAEKEGLEGEMVIVGDRIAKKLRYFQHLNAVFIENISQGNFLQDYLNAPDDGIDISKANFPNKIKLDDIGLPERENNPPEIRNLNNAE
jgi:hypothetical protein